MTGWRQHARMHLACRHHAAWRSCEFLNGFSCNRLGGLLMMQGKCEEIMKNPHDRTPMHPRQYPCTSGMAATRAGEKGNISGAIPMSPSMQ
jgi:hypothetical protein